MEQFIPFQPSSPIFILIVVIAVFLESYAYRKKFKRAYPWVDSLTSLGVGVGHQLTGLANQIFVVGVMGGFVWEHRALTLPEDNGWVYVALFFGLEFVYYWYHRAAHEIHLMWATHSSHHTPNELTLSASIRLGWTPFLSLSWLFFLPLVWLGFHPILVFGLLNLSLIYQFWLHTRLVPRLSLIEGLLNTPSAHRVHHASNDVYLDKNYGGILMIFDRIFGTYQPEERDIPLVYGLINPIDTHNPIRVVFHVWRKLFLKFIAMNGPVDKFKALFAKPGWQPSDAKVSLDHG
ncbi:MAG: sterol desaturase family protein [Methylococcus sp.]|jgi:sterol desaturase/sphingolipid hydroxylase (fatty acid hydroxylase superfamily)